MTHRGTLIGCVYPLREPAPARVIAAAIRKEKK